MELNLLVRGQSNAVLMMEWNYWAGEGALRQEVQRLLGFDGINDRVDIIYEAHDTSSATAFGGTALIGDWLTPRNGDWRQGWQIGQYERALLNKIAEVPATDRDDPTAVLWLHSEYDSANRDLTVDQWMSAVRFDAAQLRAAFGQPASALPYLFISAMPYYGTTEGHQAIRLGMERLAADASFNAAIAARMLDVDTDGDSAGWYGGGHIDAEDALQTAMRSARAVAEAFAPYAKPGSPIALAGGNIADEGPRVVTATAVGTSQLRIDVLHDKAGGFRSLDADAARGVGWSVIGPAGTVTGTATAIEDRDTLLVSFSGSLPTGGLLHYGHGYGRLEGADRSGRGNAVYDDQGLPIWTPAEGLAITPATAPPPLTLGIVRSGSAGNDTMQGGALGDSLSGGEGRDNVSGLGGADTVDGGGGNDTLFGNAGNDLLRGGAGNDVLRGDAGNDTIVTGDGADRVDLWRTHGADRVTDFALGTDIVRLPEAATSTVTAEVAVRDGVSGLLLTRPEGDTLFLEGVGMATAGQLGLSGNFRTVAPPSPPPPPPPPPPSGGQTVAGGTGDDALRGGAGADSLNGLGGSDDLQGFDGADTLRGGRDHDGMTGGAGNDVFAYARGDGEDWIMDFRPGLEKIRLEGITAGQVTQRVEARWEYTGLALRFGDGGDLYLAGVTAPLGSGDLVFA
jgi:Ca2+-binding RTX toxin-like protein